MAEYANELRFKESLICVQTNSWVATGYSDTISITLSPYGPEKHSQMMSLTPMEAEKLIDALTCYLRSGHQQIRSNAP